VNDTIPTSLAIASIALNDGKNTVVIVGADDAVLKILAGKPIVYGAYHNILSSSGVSAMWNGYITEASVTVPVTDSSLLSTPLPSVVVNGMKAVTTPPFNLVHPAKHIVFYEKDSKKGVVTEADAVSK
jgi:hypothetical protein